MARPTNRVFGPAKWSIITRTEPESGWYRVPGSEKTAGRRFCLNREHGGDARRKIARRAERRADRSRFCPAQRRGRSFAFTWAYTAINRDGIESGQAGPVFQITDSEERTMITAQEALDKIQAMYQSTIITQKIQIYDLQLQYSITKYDKESGSYQCSPIWKFFVRMDSGDGEMVHSTVTYNAETGERMG